MQSILYERFSSLVILGQPTLSGLKVSCHVHYKPRFRFRLTCSVHRTFHPLEQSFLQIKQWNFTVHFLNNIFELVISCWSGKTESWLFCLVKCFEFYIFLIGFVDLLLTKIKLCTSSTLGLEIAATWMQIVWVWKMCLQYI